MAVRVALMGTGRGAALHAVVIDRTPGVELVAVTSDVGGRAKAFCADLDRPHLAAGGHTSLPDLACDLAVVATTPEKTAEVIALASASDSPLLVESPIGLSAAAAHACRLLGTDKFIGVASHLGYAPLWAEFLARSSGLGPLGHIGLTVRREQPLRSDRSAWPGGVLPDLLAPNLLPLFDVIDPHEIAEVSATVRSLGEPSEAWGITLFSADGQLARITASWSSGMPFWDLQLAGERGALRVEFQPDPHLEDNGVDRVPPTAIDVTPPELATHGYVQQLETVVDDLRSGRPPRRSLDEVALAADVTAAAAASASNQGDRVGVAREHPVERTLDELLGG